MKKDLGLLPRKLCRRVVIDTDSGRKVCDETIHHKSSIAYLRRDLPHDICSVRVDYYRLPDGHHRDEDSSGS